MPNANGQPVIAIDGTSASGKSTLSKQLAAHYGAKRLEYSLFFRLIARHMLDQGFDPSAGTPPTEAQKAEAAHYASTLTSWEKIDTLQRDQGDALRTSEVSSTAPYFSGLPGILAQTDQTFRILIDAARQPVVAEGRTIGQYVYPSADVKLYVDAALPERARRRAEEQRSKGRDTSREEVEHDLAARDRMDQTREHQPTGYVDGLHTRFDNTHTTPEESLARAITLIDTACPRLCAPKPQRSATAR